MKWKTALALLGLCGLAWTVAAQSVSYRPYDAAEELSQMHSPAHGRYLATTDGRTLYILTNDRQNTSRCYASCTAAWPPLLADGDEPLVGAGLDPNLVGLINRADGAVQVTYAGWPLYHYARDRQAGQTRGHEVQDRWGEWLLLSPNGRPKDYYVGGYDDD